MKKLAIFLMMLMASCAKPGIRVETVEVPVPVVQTCVTSAQLAEAEQKKPAPLGAQARPSDSAKREAMMAAQILRWQGYADFATALLTGCLTSETP
jgi:hypothetical protein